jgi:short-subunit dehydrogenase
MRRDVRGRVVLITGASRGIGRRVAERLAARGAVLALTSRSVGELASLRDDLKARGCIAEIFPADLIVASAREELVTRVVERFGGLDVLLNCAGVCSFGEFASSSEAINRAVLEINFFAPVELARVCLPALTRSADGGYPAAVLNLASLCGRCGIPSLPEHCASKHALVGMTEAWRAEFARFGVDVMLVLPGLVRSDDLSRHLLRNEGRIYLDFEGAQPADEVADALVRSLERGTRERAVGWVGWGVWLSKRLWPRAVRWFMRRKVLNFARRAAVSPLRPPP